MSQLYVIVTNASSVVVGKDVYGGNTSNILSAKQSEYPTFTFTSVDVSTFNSTTYVGPYYGVNS